MENPTFKKDAWRSRWTALEQTMDHASREMKERKSERQSTLMHSINALKIFGGGQFKFFLNGFDADAPARLKWSADYPPEYTLRTTLDQIAYDMDVIVRAWQQRLPQLSAAAMIETLNKADVMAYRALTPAIRKGLIENATVVTYFQKSVNVRIIPYAPVTFIGLPVTALTTRQDLLAIPHEIGHYVYRYMKAHTKLTEDSRFTSKPTWCLAWLEEIFADVYGALIGGPVMALGFEDLVTDDPLADFTYDDGEHPVAALRPSIYHAVLAKDGRFPQLHQALVKRWQDWIAKRGAPTSFTVHGTGEQVTLTQARALLDEVVAALLDHELAGLPVEQVWSSDLGKSKEVDPLLTQFTKAVEGLPTAIANHVPDVQVTKNAKGESHLYLGLAGGAPPVTYPIADTDQVLDAIKVVAQQKGYLTPAEWLVLLDGSGWATEGPGGGNAH